MYVTGFKSDLLTGYEFAFIPKYLISQRNCLLRIAKVRHFVVTSKQYVESYTFIVVNNLHFISNWVFLDFMVQ